MKLRKENAALVPLLAILVLPLILIIGITVDTGLVLNTKNQQALLVQHIALSTLSQYIKNISEGEVAVYDSIERARRIANVNITIIDKTLKDPDRRIADTFDSIALGGMSEGGEEAHEALLEFGRYYFSEDMSDDESNPCTGEPPCFVAGDPFADDNNAVRFSMWVPSGNPIRTYLFKLIGYEHVTHRATAVATLIPRNDVFLLDLSPTVYWDNFTPHGVKNSEGKTIRGSRNIFSYQIKPPPHPDYIEEELGNELSTEEACGEGAYDSKRCPVDVSSEYQKIWQTKYFSQAEAEDEDYRPSNPDASWALWQDSGLDGPHPSFKYRDDYRAFAVDFESGPKYFLTHYFGDGPQNISTPRPLTGILNAVYTGMKILEERTLSSDRLGIYGFDSDPDRTALHGLNISEFPRHLDLAPIPGLLEEAELSEQWLRFHKFLRASWMGSRYDYLQMIDLGLFPIPQRFSDLQGAFYLGLDKISQSPTYKYAKNSIFMFTDGLANCPRDVEYDEDQQMVIKLRYIPDQPCRHSGRFIYESINDINNPLFIKAFQERGIAISIALVGQNIRPHFVARKSSSDGCMDHIEAAKLDYKNFIDSGIPEDAESNSMVKDLYIAQLQQDIAEQNPLYIANELYKIVNATKGLWIPIMPQAFAVDPDTGESSVTAFNFNALLQEACRNADNIGDVITTEDFPFYDSNTGRPIVDESGRVLFDPVGRSPERQMKDAMYSVLQSPFMLAE